MFCVIIWRSTKTSYNHVPWLTSNTTNMNRRLLYRINDWVYSKLLSMLPNWSYKITFTFIHILPKVLEFNRDRE